MHRNFLLFGTFYAAVAVAFGAFGAHGLTKIASADSIAIFKTGVQYQMYHALALLAVAIIFERFANGWLQWAGYLFCFGIIFFSGSLYLITALDVYQRNVPVFIGILTPVGGLFFVAGWLCFFGGVLRKR